MTVPPEGRRYAEILASTRIHERALFLQLRAPNELELQARWFAGEFGKKFVSTTGDRGLSYLAADLRGLTRIRSK